MGEDCAGNLVNVTSLLDTAFSADTQALTDAEKELVNEVCLDIYNEMTFFDCDPFFRIATSCDLFLTLNNGDGTGVMEASCRGCDDDNGDMWDSDFGRRRRQLKEQEDAQVDFYEEVVVPVRCDC